MENTLNKLEIFNREEIAFVLEYITAKILTNLTVLLKDKDMDFLKIAG